MPCVSPIKAYRFYDVIPKGYKDVSLRAPPEGFSHRFSEVMLPCGKCIECKNRYKRDWALRMQAECDMHDENAFITFTYDDDHVPLSPSGLYTLHYKDMQDFMKRLRIYFDREAEKKQKDGLSWKKPKVSYYYCGEYGSITQRPHYHMILFGWFPPVNDRYIVDDVENTVFESPLLEKIWKKGRVQVQYVNFDACAYVAGYVEKKRNDWDDFKKMQYYGDRVYEMSFCSRRPAIGKRWFDRYKLDLFPADHFVSGGLEFPVPQYFYKLFRKNANEFLLNNNSNFEKDFNLYENVRRKRLDSLQNYSDSDLQARRAICESKRRLHSERNGDL